jgi:glycosyltransferase 2 family protein
LKKHHLGAGLGILAMLAAVVFVYYRWHDSGFSWPKFVGVFINVDWSWLALALALILATYVGRAMRWEIMLRPLSSQVRLWGLVVATCIGFTAVVLFGRAGEPVRPYLIARKEGVSFSSQVAAWLVERILDLLMVLLIFGIALTQISRSGIQPGPHIQSALEAAGLLAGITGAASLALLLGLRHFRGNIRTRLMESLSFLPDVVHQKVARFLDAFEEGMQSTQRQSYVWLLVLYTIVEWLVIAGSFFCVFRAFPATAGLRITDVIIALGFVSFGSVLQIPGVGGGMQIATVLVLTEFYGISLEAASGIALVLWIITFVVIVPLGLGMAFHEGIKWRSLRHIEESSSSLGL